MIETVSQPPEKYTLRNAYQWLAMITMVMDHVGYMYSISELRYFGRLAMPMYAILFVMTVRSGHVNLKRLLFLALASQLPMMYLFEVLKLNIIFGFWIFAWTVNGIEKQKPLQAFSGVMMMLIPVSYGWYLYVTLYIFWGIRHTLLRNLAFAAVTGIYTWLLYIHPRQLLAAGVPWIRGIKAPRPNKYLYRYFYPGHLIILAIVKYVQTHSPLW